MHRTALGLISGAGHVLRLSMETDETCGGPSRAARDLCGSVLAATLAKIFAEVAARAMETGVPVPMHKAIGAAARRSQPTLPDADVPTAFFILAGSGWLSVATATALSHLFCIFVRRSWRAGGGASPIAGGGPSRGRSFRDVSGPGWPR